MNVTTLSGFGLQHGQEFNVLLRVGRQDHFADGTAMGRGKQWRAGSGQCAGTIEVTGPLGTFAVPAARPLSSGAEASFVIAADRVGLADTGSATPAGMARLEGTVIGLEFVGSTQTIFIDVPGGREFRVQKQQHEIESLGLAPGRRVGLSWDPKHAWLLPQNV